MAAIDLGPMVMTRARRLIPSFTIRGRHLLILDVGGTGVGIVLALALWSEGLPAAAFPAAVLPTAMLPVLIRPIVNWQLGLYRRLWRYASAPDMVRVVEAALIGTLGNILAFYLLLSPLGIPGAAGFPTSFWGIEALAAVTYLGGSRLVIRVVTDIRPRASTQSVARVTPALLFGAGRVGAMIARSAIREPAAGVRPVGFLDDDALLHGNSIAGVKVLGGLGDLKRAIEQTGARTLLITMASAPGDRVREIVEAATRARLDVRTVPPIHELLDGSVDAYRVRRVRVEDLLSRPVALDHAPGVAALIEDRCVIVTGAGGSIGSELARQVYALNPRHLVLVDRAESPLYLIQRELEIRSLQARGRGQVTAHLGNVASRSAMAQLVAATRPDVIFHAAAYKHVPMMESHPSEGVHVNIGGTLSMLDAARAAGVPRFVLVSTDKAVEPSSIMGATKRVAEGLVAATAAETGLSYISVRFGNVLGSAGSVLPIFMEQLEHGQPLTVTHPDMTRFFMTIAEASWLILDAFSIGQPGDVFVLDMGQPVRILDLCRDLVRLSGRRPDSVPIQFTGLRAGEKLHEQLFYDFERIEPTTVPKVLRAIGETHPSAIHEDAREVLNAATGTMDDVVRTRLFALADSLLRPGPSDAMEHVADSEPEDRREAVEHAIGSRLAS